MKKLIGSTLIILIFLLLNCSASEIEKSNVSLLHDIWAIESIEGEKYRIDSTTIQQPLIEIHLKDEKLVGHTGCNQLNGDVYVEGSRISFSEVITTKMFCEGNFEHRFLTALGDVNNYKIEKLRLFLYEDDKELLTFRKVD